MYAPPGGPPHVFVGGSALGLADLLEFINDDVGGRPWNVYDRTADTGVGGGQDPVVYAPPGGPPHVFTSGWPEDLLEWFPDNVNEQVWNVYDHTDELAGRALDQSRYALPPPGQGVVTDPTPNPHGPVTFDQVTNYGDNTFTEWRLVQDLRTNAAFNRRDFRQQLPMDPPPEGWDERDPVTVLKNAALLLARDPIKAMAMADLAVTGRMSHEALAAKSFQTPADVVAQLVTNGASKGAATTVVARAQKVAWAIRGNPSWRATLRPQLGWIGVSGEDDAPHRPCNVASLPGPQFDIEVPDIQVANGTLTVKTRIVIAEDPWPTPTATMSGSPPALLPPDGTPVLSPASDYVFLYMAGDCSRAEEASDMIPALLWAAQQHGKQASVIAFDMIGWGYSARKAFDRDGNPVLFDQGAIFADGQPVFPWLPYPDNPPALQFLEDFVVGLIQTLSQQSPHLDLNKVIPIGGSLGGNLALRLGRRTDLKWLTAVCGWSPGSVWSSYAAGAKGLQGWTNRIAIGDCTDWMNALEDRPPDVQATPAGSRNLHFAEVFDQDTASFQGITLVPAQALMWYRDGDWLVCKARSLCYDRLDRREIYDPTFRRWHWRISQDQLIYSHWDPDPATRVPRYQLNAIPMLLGAGEDDDYSFVGIYSNTVRLAQAMTNCPGISLFLSDTGHSIHNERPKQLSRAIFDFLGQYSGGQLTWRLAGNTSGFGQVDDGRPFWTGDFSGTGRTQLMFYFPGNQDWELGTVGDDGQLTWRLAGNTSGFGQVWDGRPFWTGDFSGTGRTQLMFYFPGNQDWELGTVGDDGQLTWRLAGNTSRFGQVWDGRPFWTGDFSGTGRTQLMFYFPGNQDWELGTMPAGT